MAVLEHDDADTDKMSPHTKIDTLILSDVHLGSPASKARLLNLLLRRHSFKRLVLLGDIIDDMGLHHLEQDHRDFFDTLKALSDDGDCEIVWILGNHDRHLKPFIKKLSGVSVHEHFSWVHNDKRFAAIHGDQFDLLISNKNKVDKFAHFFFFYLQFLDRKGRHLVKIIDRSNNILRRISEKVSSGAIEFARKNDAHYIFCGHTHSAMQTVHDDGTSPVHYVNVGCWTHTPSTFAVVDDKGSILLEEFA